MTDRSEWSNEEINEAIFKAKGWVDQVKELIWTRGIAPDIETTREIPDYCEDWQLSGELMEEMPGVCLSRNGTGKWYCDFNNEDYIDVNFSFDFEIGYDNPKRAIAEKYLEWREEE